MLNIRKNVGGKRKRNNWDTPWLDNKKCRSYEILSHDSLLYRSGNLLLVSNANHLKCGSVSFFSLQCWSGSCSSSVDSDTNLRPLVNRPPTDLFWASTHQRHSIVPFWACKAPEVLLYYRYVPYLDPDPAPKRVWIRFRTPAKNKEQK